MPELDDESKIVKNLVRPGLDGRKVCSQEHISSINIIVFFNDFAFIIQFQRKG